MLDPTMSTFAVHRATERDLEPLRRLNTEVASHRGGLLGLRRDRFAPEAWIAARVPFVVVAEGASVVGFAVAISDNVPLGVAKCAEAIAYVMPAQRRRGAARAAMSELLAAARTMGLWKMIAYGLPEDAATRGLLERADFRQVGVLVKHAQLEGSWRDVTIYERLVLAARKSMPSIPGV